MARRKTAFLRLMDTESKLRTPPRTPREDGKDRLVEDSAAIKSAKRKNTSSDEVSQPSKRRCFDGRASGTKVEAQRAKATGIQNHLNACYINPVVQILTNIPRMANHYRTLAGRVTSKVAEYVRNNERTCRAVTTRPETLIRRGSNLKNSRRRKSQICGYINDLTTKALW